jgi:hypothetical protein
MATKQEKQQLIDTLKFTPCTYTVTMWGYGGEKVMGTVDPAAWNYCLDHRIDLQDIAWDSDASEELGLDEDLLPFPPGSWYECDNMAHVSGVSRSAGTIQISDEHNNTVFEKSLDDIVGGGCDGEPDWCCNDEVWIGSRKAGEIVFVGSSNEKGTFFEGEILLRAPFNIELLELHYDEVDGEEIVNGVYYDGEEIDNNGGSTNGKSSDFVMVKVIDDRGNWERYDPTADNAPDLYVADVGEKPTIKDLAPVDDEPELETTDWYPGSVDPVHVGHYETQRAPPLAWPFPSEAMLEWTGKKWLDIDGKVVKQIAQWRGLKEPVA